MQTPVKATAKRCPHCHAADLFLEQDGKKWIYKCMLCCREFPVRLKTH